MFYRSIFLAIATIPLTATIGLCQISFGAISPGVLEPSNSYRVLESTVPAEIPISATLNNGETSLVVSVDAPILLSGPGSSDVSLTSAVSYGGQTAQNGSNLTITAPPSSFNLRVDMRGERSSLYPSGTYQYSIPLTITAD